jgi:protease PrsW
MQHLLISIPMAVIPAFLLVYYFYKSKSEAESPRVIIVTLLLGIAITIPILLLRAPYEIILKSIKDPLYYGIFKALFVASIPEEIFKYSILIFYCVRQVKFNKEIDGIIFGAIASLGFAAFENISYVLDGGIGAAIIRALTSVPTHALMGAVMGYFLFSFYKSKSFISLFYSIGIPIFFHAAYDFPLFVAEKIRNDGTHSFRFFLILIIFILILFGIYRYSIKLVIRVKNRENQQENGPLFDKMVENIKHIEKPL